MNPKAQPKLGDYRSKRSPEATNEPFGGEVAGPRADAAGTLSGAFVVHLHDATRRHYDLRLEVGGALASFAVPRGPSLDPDDKLLAVRTEDHPIEYLGFEDVIPDKQYGAGPMIAWDRGMVEYLEGPAEDELANGKVHVMLRGMKLRGRFALVKLAKSKKGNEWLLFKKEDEHASKERDVLAELPRSVLSGLTVDELARAPAIAAAHVRSAFARGAASLTDAAARALSDAARSPLAAVAAGGVGPAAGGGYLYDAELDGVRVLASRQGERVTLRLFDAAGGSQEIEELYPEIARALAALPAERLVLDGELVAFDASGHPSVALLAQRIERIKKGDLHGAVSAIPAVLVAKDLLMLGDADLRPAPLEARRALLAELLPGVGFLRAAPPLEGPLEPILAFCAEHAMPGVVAKAKASPYPSAGASAGWVFVPSGGAPRSRVTIDHRALDGGAPSRRVTITNRAKVFWPDEGLTKGDLCDYYASVAPALLPYVADRPVILVRYPDGIRGKSFFQWNVPPGMPSWVRTLAMKGEGDAPKRGFLIDDAETLLYIANLGCIPLHLLAARVPRLDQADFATVDFDVKQSELKHAITLALRLRAHLDAIGLPSFPKTSGQSGLHVLVPLGEGQSFATARALAELLGELLVRELPDLATMERTVARRGARVYVDTGQTGTSRAIVAPYSVRAVPGATISTPLDWSEVTADLDPRAFTLKTVPARLAARGDPMRPLLGAKPDVVRAVTKLASLVSGLGARPA